MPMKNKIKKLFSLPLREIVYRLREKGFIRKEHLFFKLKIQPVCRQVNKVDTPPLFFTEGYDATQRKRLIMEHLDEKAIIQEADSIVGGNVLLLGREMVIPSGPGWHKDPVDGVNWPNLFYPYVRHHQSVRDCDIKFIWELNRHQYLVPLAKAFWISKNEKYAKKLFEIITDWIDFTTYNQGVNWISSLEHAVRLFSWVWGIQLCRDSLYYSQSIRKIENSIYEQAYYISRHLSYYSSPYNHLVGEAAALHLIGLLFPEFDKSAEWEKTGLQILEDTVENQFYSDGTTVEQAFFYHHFTLGFYLQTIYLRNINHKSVSNRMLKRVEKALEASFHLHMPDGNLPMVGDIDSARSICFSTTLSWNFSGFHQLGAVLFDRNDFKLNSKRVSEEILWILNDPDLVKYRAIQTQLPQTSFLAETGGYFINRDDWTPTSNYICFDFGKLAEGLSTESIPSAAHGHLDGLSIILEAYGKPFLVDGGFYTYFGDLDWHKAFRHEETHNTLTIEGYRQAEYCGRLKWQNAVRLALLNYEESSDHFVCSGEIDFSDKVSHKRTIYYQKKRFWMLQDRVRLDIENRTVKNYFNFGPDVKVAVRKKDNSIFASQGDIRLIILPLGEISIDLFNGDDRPTGGWICSGYGVRHRSYRAELEWIRTDNQNKFNYLLIPLDDNVNEEDILYDHQTYKLHFRHLAETYLIDIDSGVPKQIVKG